MAPRGHRRPSPAHGPLAVLGLLAPVAGLLFVGALWLMLAAPFAADGDEPGARSSAGAPTLRASASREDDRARLSISGRTPDGRMGTVGGRTADRPTGTVSRVAVADGAGAAGRARPDRRAGAAGAPLVVRVLGRTDVAGPCPAPAVRSSGALVPPPGSVRVGWSSTSGRVPGTTLPAGSRFRLAGTVAARGSGALRLCVHLVRTGRAAGVVRTVRVVVPSRAGVTPLSVPLRSAVDGVLLPVLRVVGLVVALALTLWLVLRIRRRVRLARPETATRAGRRRARARDRSAPISPEPAWSRALDLPPLPDGVRVPDAPPWDAGGSLEEDPRQGGADDRRPGGSGDPRRGDADDRRRGGRAAADPTDPRSGPPATTDFDHRSAPARTVTPAAPQDAAGSADVTPAADPATTDQVTIDPATADPGSADPAPLTRATGTAGASARAVGARREERWRERRRLEAEAAGQVWDPTERAPFHVRAWALGAEGEELAAERFAALARGYPGVHVLHDRREPGRGLANIDHVLVGPAGVVVADTKNWAGVVRIEAGRLHVRGKDRTSAVDHVCGQVSSVRAVLAAAGLGAIPVLGVLHWTRSDGAALDGSIELSGVPLLDSRGTMVRASDGTVLGRDGVAQVLAVLRAGLRPAG